MLLYIFIIVKSLV